MPDKTIELYNANAKEFADAFDTMTPTKSHELALAFFHRGEETLDIGCGSGRDTAFLADKGFQVTGLDASTGLLNEAKKRHPSLNFREDSLPSLTTAASDSVSNIFCNAVIMHLNDADLVNSVMNCLRILRAGGRALFTFRDPGTNETDKGRHYSRIPPGRLAELFESLGGKVLLIESEASTHSWHYLVAEKTSLEKKDGIARIQEIITNDNKTASYKLALLRALCDLARDESHTVIWEPQLDFVIVPLERLALSWLRYYWPLIKKDIKQIRSSPNLAFEKEVKALQEKIANPRDAFLLYEDDTPTRELMAALRKIAKTIVLQPVRYAGGGKSPVFSPAKEFRVETDQGWKSPWFEKFNGIKVPANLWRDIRLFHHWIEKSLIVEWVELTTERLDPNRSASEIFKIFFDVSYEDKRTTHEIRKLIGENSSTCIWTGKKIKNLEIDHVIPFALWRNNDLWNLLPAERQVNNSKRMLLPHPELLKSRGSAILQLWERYQDHFGDRFKRQAIRALGQSQLDFSPQDTLNQLIVVSAQLHHSRGVPYFRG